MRPPGPLAPLLAGLLLAACGDGLYTAEGLPPLGGGGAACGADQVECTVGGQATCVTEGVTSCGSCGHDCTAAGPVENGAHACVAHACSFTCNPGFLRGAAGCERAALLAAGLAHTCAAGQTGRLHCWGDDASGQVSGTPGPQPVALPLEVRGGGATAVAAGARHTCAVVGGAVECWGAGAGAAVPSPAPAGVVGLSAGADHTCALRGGAVTCWGNPAAIRTPPALGTVTAITSGSNHACALEGGTGTLTCWGDGSLGQLGTGPVAGVRAAGAGHDRVCDSLLGTRKLFCWGDGSATAAEHPRVNFESDLVAVGRAHTCMHRVGEDLRCVGDNGSGQLGQDGVPPGEVSSAGGVLGSYGALVAGGDHSCALFPDGTLRCWGANDRGQLGLGDTATPTPFGPRLVQSR